jgi:NodT family efflux transporter outer membrane factor (OMF) lipoprotein
VPPATWRHGEAADGAPIAENWWREFGDGALDSLVERAVRENDDLQIAIAHVAEARASLSLSRAALLPHVDAQASGVREAGVSPFGLADQQTGGGFGASIAYDTDLFGRLRNERGAAQARLFASQGVRDTVQLFVASAAAASYITLRGLDARLEIAQSTLAVRADSLRVAQRRYALGYSTALDLKQADAEYLATQRLIPQLHLAIESEENALSILLGNAPGAINRGARLVDIRTPELPRALPSTVVRHRPDIYAAEEQLVAADRALSAARAAFLPNITLEGGAGRAYSTLYPSPITLWSIGGSVLAPIFEGGALRAQQQIEAARQDQAAFAYRRTVLTAFQEVEAQMTTIQDSSEQLKILVAQQDALAAATRLATRRYRAGYSSYLEQLDAERGLLDAQLAEVQVEAARLLAFVDLFRALGGGWQRPDAQSADIPIAADFFKRP